jgi:RND family efflux transporter MFP subunit
MEQNEHPSDLSKKSMSPKKTILISLIILLTGAAITFLIFMTEPKAERGGATKETAMLVDVINAEYGTFRPKILATGTVKPSKDIILKSRVRGEILKQSEAFTPGGFVKKGEILLNIDPADYQNHLQQMQSALRQAIADLNIEMGRQNVAQKDYKILAETLSDEQESLILRKPQLNAARSKVDAARAVVAQAELELKRTTIKAPFDAHIVSRNVNVGSQVSPGDSLGRLVGIETYWIETTVPLSKIRWLDFQVNNKKAGSNVRIRNRSAWLPGEYRTGNLFRLVGILEDGTRLARVLVTVPDPLARMDSPSGLPKLMIGSFVEVTIQARELGDVIRLNRDYIRKGRTVWVMDDGKLQIRSVDIILRDDNYAYISSGLKKDEMVVTTNLTTVVEGAGLRLEAGTPGNEEKPKQIKTETTGAGQ